MLDAGVSSRFFRRDASILMEILKRHATSVVALAITAVALLVGCGPAGTALQPLRPSSWQVIAGSSSQQEALQALQFFPATITINAGDTVTWTFPAGEPHTVTFLGSGQATPPPATDPSDADPAGGSTYDGSTYTSSGFLLMGKSYSLTFTKPGTYPYYCLIHMPEMEGTVVVQPAGYTYPATQAIYSAQAQAGIAADLNSASSALTLFPYVSGGPHLVAGISPGLATGTPAPSTVLRFLDGPSLSATAVTVAVGTTVTWTNLSNNEPHTVTFPPVGQTPPPTLSPFSPPSGGSSYDGTTLTNSGVLWPGASYSLTFTKAGTYTYYCLFHDDEGHIGTVNVGGTPV